MWFMEEVGELSAALRGGTHDERALEFADVLAWLVTLANCSGRGPRRGRPPQVRRRAARGAAKPRAAAGWSRSRDGRARIRTLGTLEDAHADAPPRALGRRRRSRAGRAGGAQKPKLSIEDARVGLPPGRFVGESTDAQQAAHLVKRNNWAPIYVTLKMAAEVPGAAKLVVESFDSDDLKTTLTVPLGNLSDRKPGESSSRPNSLTSPTSGPGTAAAGPSPSRSSPTTGRGPGSGRSASRGRSTSSRGRRSPTSSRRSGRSSPGSPCRGKPPRASRPACRRGPPCGTAGSRRRRS
jgi:hypothetical protein